MAGKHFNEGNLTGANGLVPRGVIAMWRGTTPPAGWALCNGQNGTPDLRDRFIVGAGGGYAVGTTGGAVSASHSHSYSITTGNPINPSGIPYVGGSNGRAANYTHTHVASGTSSSATLENRPPYYALAFIMKL